MQVLEEGKMEAMHDDDNNTALPASIEVAWGLRERPHKGPKRGLSIDRIVEAAVKIALSDGLAAVSMSRIAAELGAGPMSLYRYVASKEELLALMVDAVYGPPPTAQWQDEGWREGLSRWAWASLAVLRRHPWILHIQISGPPITPNQIAWMEQALLFLRDTRLTEKENISVILLLISFIRNEAALAVNISAANLASGSTAEEATSAYGRLLARVTNAERFPALHAVIAAGAFDAPDDPDAEFSFGLERILDGIDVLVRSRAEGR